MEIEEIIQEMNMLENELDQLSNPMKIKGKKRQIKELRIQLQLAHTSNEGKE